VEGSGLLVELVVLVLIVSILVGNASEVSGLSAVTYSLTVWSSGTTSLTACVETCISAWLPVSISDSSRNSISGRISTSGIAAELRPPRVRDLRSEEVGSMRLN